MHGTWKTEGGGGGGLPTELIGVVVIGVMIVVGGAVASAIAALMVWIIAAVVITFVLAVAGGTAFLVLRSRRGGKPPLEGVVGPLVKRYELAPEPKKALPQPTTLIIGGQHVHVQGADLSTLTDAFRTRDAITITPEEI